MPATSTQQFLSVDAIREDALILKDGSLRVILMCSSLNLALKSSDEQDAVIYQYQNFLNSLDFSLQFTVHSRRLNIEPYLGTLAERQKEQENELMKIQIGEYMEFIRTFTSMTNIMSKTFYVTVPFIPVITKPGGMLEKAISFLPFRGEKRANPTDVFNEYKNQLWQRVETVVTGLRRFGIRSAPLTTEELIELFYGLYNPTEFENAGTEAPPDKDQFGESPAAVLRGELNA